MQNDLLSTYNFLHFGSLFFKYVANSMDNDFWKEIFFIIEESFKFYPTKVSDLIYEPLWHNPKITIDRNPVFYSNWYKKGIISVYDLLDCNGKISTYRDFCTKFDFSPPFTTFYGIRVACLNFLNYKKDQSFSVLLPHFSKYYSDVISNKKTIYNCYVTSLYEKPKFEKKWELTFNTQFTPEWWKKAHTNSIDFTSDIKLKWFQIRITHRIISTNTFLYKIGIAASALCTFCNNEAEDLFHLYWTCPITSNFWKSFQTWILEKTNEVFHLTAVDVFFGKTDTRQVVNLLISLAKFHIHKRRLNGSLPNLNILKREIINYYNTEKSGLTENSSEKIAFNRKWFSMVSLLM